MDFIESTPTLKRPIRPGRMVGHSEMTDEQDRVVIEDFRQGRLNLLVATDIAQEGLPSAGLRALGSEVESARPDLHHT